MFKYIAKRMKQLNENTRVTEYIYRDRIDIYITPRDATQEVIRTSISFKLLQQILKEADEADKAKETA